MRSNFLARRSSLLSVREQLLHCRVRLVSTEEFNEAFAVEELVVRKVEACALGRNLSVRWRNAFSWRQTVVLTGNNNLCIE